MSTCIKVFWSSTLSTKYLLLKYFFSFYFLEYVQRFCQLFNFMNRIDFNDMFDVSSLFEIIQLSWRSFSSNDLSNAYSSFSSSHFLKDFKSYIDNNSSTRYFITFYVTTNDHATLSQLNALTITINRAMTKVESRNSYSRIDERFLFTLETHIRESSNSFSS